ncbi:MAG: hypothetical protein R3Y40_00500 [Eubacteriales bacterium]
MKKGWKKFWAIICVLLVIGIILCILGIALGAYKETPVQVGNSDIYLHINENGIYFSGEYEEELEETFEWMDDDLDIDIKIDMD